MESRARLAARVAEIAPFHVMEVQTAARALEAAGRTVIHMEIGEPDFPTPAPILAEAQRAIAQGNIYYTSALGLPELRTAIAKHYADQYEQTSADGAHRTSVDSDACFANALDESPHRRYLTTLRSTSTRRPCSNVSVVIVPGSSGAGR